MLLVAGVLVTVTTSVPGGIDRLDVELGLVLEGMSVMGVEEVARVRLSGVLESGLLSSGVVVLLGG